MDYEFKTWLKSKRIFQIHKYIHVFSRNKADKEGKTKSVIPCNSST